MSEPIDEAADASTPSSQIETNEALTLLADDCRRRILMELLDREPDESVRLCLDANSLFPESSERLAVELYHNHLPRLDAEDVISWDEESDVIRRGPAFPAIRPFVKRLNQHSDELPSDWQG